MYLVHVPSLIHLLIVIVYSCVLYIQMKAGFYSATRMEIVMTSNVMALPREQGYTSSAVEVLDR